MEVLPDLLRTLVDQVPDEPAYVVARRNRPAEPLTFRAWHETSSRLARGLMARGVGPGDRVAVGGAVEDTLAHLVAHVAIHKAGGVVVPVNTKLSASEIRRVFGHARPRAAVAGRELAAVLTGGADRPPGLTAVVATDDADGEATGVIPWSAALADDASDVQADVGPDDPAEIVYTSGTTGAPKGVLSRHRNALAVAPGAVVWNGMTWLHASPLFTAAGQSFIYVPMRLGMTGLHLPRFDAALFLDLVESDQVQMAFLVPAMVELLLARDDLARRDLGGLRMVTVGSAPITPTSLVRLDDLLPNGTVMNAFALTESGAAQVVMPADEARRRPSSVGRALPPTEVRIVDVVGEPLPAGEIGEIHLRNPGREREYFRDPAATAATWQDGWLLTGDLGYVDEDGFLYVVGRAKDVIIRGGHNVHAVDVEAALAEHPDVATCAVVGIPDRVLGEEVAAVVVPRPGSRPDPDALRSFVRERVASYAWPRVVTLRSGLPRNDTGKVRKDRLRDELAAERNGPRRSPQMPR